MRLSEQQIKALQTLLNDEYGLEYSTEEAQQAGLAIMRFVLAKHRKNQSTNNNLQGE